MNTMRVLSRARHLAHVLVASTIFLTSVESRSVLVQSLDRIYRGDDPSEVFEFNLTYDSATPSLVRFNGFVENLSPFDETGVRFLLGWGRTATNYLEESVIYPEWPASLMGVRLPPADPAGGPVRVPLAFHGRIGYAPAALRFDVEGLGCCDYFRLAGTLTIEPVPALRLARLDDAIRITWSTNSSGYRLEFAERLPSSTWASVTNTVSVAEGEFSVTVDMAAPQRFYRLKSP